MLNKYNKYKMAQPACILNGNCVEEGDDSHDDWRNLKQVTDTADEDMEDQLNYLFRATEIGVENCQEGFPDEEELMERCEKKAVRHMCGKFESMNQLCDYTAQQRKNEMDGTYYFDEGMLPKTCSGDVRASLLEMCTEAEKIPGISVDHWPWQGHSLNLNKRGFRCVTCARRLGSGRSCVCAFVLLCGALRMSGLACFGIVSNRGLSCVCVCVCMCVCVCVACYEVSCVASFVTALTVVHVRSGDWMLGPHAWSGQNEKIV